MRRRGGLSHRDRWTFEQTYPNGPSVCKAEYNGIRRVAVINPVLSSVVVVGIRVTG